MLLFCTLIFIQIKLRFIYLFRKKPGARELVNDMLLKATKLNNQDPL